MEGRGDVPLAVWVWCGKNIVLLWGEYALNTMRRIAKAEMPTACANLEWQSASGEFDILVFKKSDNQRDNYDYGGEPVLCYNVLASLMPSGKVITQLMDHFLAVKRFPVIWAFNPHVPCPSLSGIQVCVIREHENYQQHMEALFGRSYIAKWDEIVRDTATLPVEMESASQPPDFQPFSSDDENLFFS